MRRGNWKTYMIWITVTEAVGGLSGWLSREGSRIFSETVAQPPLSPPGWLFPVAWGILYALMGFSAARVSLQPPSPHRSKGLNLYIAQLIVNFFWSLIFFNVQRFGFAFWWLLLLLGLVIVMTQEFRKADPIAALLQIPYILWLLFASYLNAGVWYLNK
jgi:tryptophan-rich sensory protein